MNNGLQILTTKLIGLMILVLTPLATSDLPNKFAQKENKLTRDLQEILSETDADELVWVSIVMEEQTARADIEAARLLPDKWARRAAVIDALKTTAEASQEDLLAYLDDQQKQGTVGPLIRPLWIHNVVGAKVTPAVAREIAERDDVAYINDDATLGDKVFPVQPVGPAIGGPNAAVECGVAVMEADRVWNDLGYTGTGVVVAVIDTGCCVTHPDLVNQIWVNPGEIPNNNIDDDNNGFVDDINGWNMRDNNPFVTDTNSHGTHVAGSVAGDGAGGTETGCAPDCSVMVLKYWNSFAGEQVVWNSIQYAVDNNADVISGSFGWPHSVNPDRTTWRMTVENSIAAGVVSVYAAGNEGGGNPPDNVRTPGDIPDVITVGATDCSDNIAGFSSRGPVTWQNIPPYFDWTYPPGKIKPSVSAPGVNTVSCDNSPCSGYSTKSGTSMATPHTSGAIALMLQANPNLTPEQVKQILMDTSVDLGANGMDNSYGAGRVDAYEAVLGALSFGPTQVAADSVNEILGTRTQGNLSDTEESDDQYLCYFRGAAASPLLPSIDLEFEGVLPSDSPTSLSVKLEAQCNSNDVTQTIEMYNFNTNSYEEVDSREASHNSDSIVEVNLTGDVTRFVEAGTGTVRTRVTYFEGGFGIFLGWEVCIDQFGWEVVN